MSQVELQITAAVVRAKGGPFQLEKLTLEPPRSDEVLVRMVACGMCHTDLVARDQSYDVPHPIVLGHEGAGIVEQVGSSVRSVSPGDHVVMSYKPDGSCKVCLAGKPYFCVNTYALSFGGCRLDGSTALRDEMGRPVHSHFFSQSSFGTFALANEMNVVKVPREAPLERLGPLGCGIQTGAGAVFNALRVSPGSSFAAFGAGAVGLSAVMAARIAGAARIIAVDVVPSRLALAMEIGATHVIDSRERDPVATIREITDGGADFTLEATGRTDVLRQAIDSAGVTEVCGIVGAAPLGAEAKFNVNEVMLPGKTIRGIIMGESLPKVFIPRLVDLHLQGRFPFDKLIRFYGLDDINQAAEDSESGKTVKPIIRLQ